MTEINMDDGDVEMVDAAQEEVEQHLVLTCNGCLKTALLVTGCGHLFCQSCVNTFVHINRQCPVCQFHVCQKMIFPIYNGSAKEDSPECGICLEKAAPQVLQELLESRRIKKAFGVSSQKIAVQDIFGQNEDMGFDAWVHYMVIFLLDSRKLKQKGPVNAVVNTALARQLRTNRNLHLF